MASDIERRAAPEPRRQPLLILRPQFVVCPPVCKSCALGLLFLLPFILSFFLLPPTKWRHRYTALHFCMLPWTQMAWNACLCVFGRPQGAPADESDGLPAGSGWQREAGAGHAQFLRAVQEDLHRRPGAEIIKGKDAGDAAGIGSRPEVRTPAACRGRGGGLDGAGLCQVFFFSFFVLSTAIFMQTRGLPLLLPLMSFFPPTYCWVWRGVQCTWSTLCWHGVFFLSGGAETAICEQSR